MINENEINENELIEKLMAGETVTVDDVLRPIAQAKLVELREAANQRATEARRKLEAEQAREVAIETLLSLDRECQSIAEQLSKNGNDRRAAMRPFDERELALRQQWHTKFVSFSSVFVSVTGTFWSHTIVDDNGIGLRDELRERGGKLEAIEHDIIDNPPSPSALALHNELLGR